MAACQRLSTAFTFPIRTQTVIGSSLSTTKSTFLPSISLSTTTVRHASHAEQGRANGVKDGKGRRLGAKKTAGELVVPGNIIFRQRGTKWHPGDNTQLGRDHTIHATVKGYVRYYRDPLRHPKRRYIGVVFEKHQQLPVNPSDPRRRKLNMIAVPFKEDNPYVKPIATDEVTATKSDGTVLRMRSNYMFKEANWEIGRAAEKAGVNVKPFKKNDRWLAWKKRAAKADRVLEIKAAQREKKAKKAANKAKGMEFARNKGKQIKAAEKSKAKLA